VGREVNGALTLYVADAGSDRVRVIAAGQVTTLAGGGATPDPEGVMIDGTGAAAVFSAPAGLALSADGATLYVADQGHEVIRAVNVATAQVTTIAGDVNEADAFDGIAPPLSQLNLALALRGSILRFFDGGHMFMLQDRAAVPAMINFLQESGA
jgi:hypothetical protein